MLLLICIICSGGVDADVSISAMLMNKSFLKGSQRKRRVVGGKELRGVALRRAKLEAFYVLVLPPLPLRCLLFYYYFFGNVYTKPHVECDHIERSKRPRISEQGSHSQYS